MKNLRPLFAAVLVTTPAWSAEEDPIPQPLPAGRYAAMAGQSPFALATAAAPVAAPQASFAANWYVSGIARLGDVDFVTIKSRDAASQFSLFGREPNPEHGVSVASVNWSDTVGKSTVILQKGTEMAKLEFNEAELRGPAVVATPAPANVASALSAAAAANALRKPGTMPATPQLPTRMVPPPVVTPNRPGVQLPSGVNLPVEIRRRERVIPVPR